jgi:hypothetical protein
MTSLMSRDKANKFVLNMTTDLSNLNRMKSIKLRGKYISARKNIKK